jgi:hypothetical protein
MLTDQLTPATSSDSQILESPAAHSFTSAASSAYPSLFQINTRVLLTDLSRRLGRRATLDDIPDGELDRLAHTGFDWLWFLGVWQTGPAARKVSLENAMWRQEFEELLPDLQGEDICGSCFAVRSYNAHSDFGGDAALERLRDRVRDRGMRLLLDFVPNHTAPDHAWALEHPKYYVHGSEELLRREPQNYTRLAAPEGQRVFAYGRDPYFDGWPDTLQLNYAEPGLQDAMASELERIAGFCDGVRCDMAMLILPEVFEKTWGLAAEPFWPKAIARARARNPRFLFMAEVYWDLEWTLQQQGFDYTYDKRLYDRLRGGHARPVRDHFRADMSFQEKSVRFLENHDEPMAAATFAGPVHEAAAVLTYFCPGLRFFHQGQTEGWTKKVPVHLARRPAETSNEQLVAFYDRLIGCLQRPEARNGEWGLLDCKPAWEGNWTWDSFICFFWRGPGPSSLLVAVNCAPYRGQCYVSVPLSGVESRVVSFMDLMSPAIYDRCADDILTRGLYLDLPPWGYHVFDVAFATE